MKTIPYSKWPSLAGAVLVLALGAAPTQAEDESLADGARKAGQAIGSTAREIKDGAKKVGKAIGQGAKEAGKAVGNAAKEGGKAVKQGFNGED